VGALPTLYAATAPGVVPMGNYGPDGLMEMRGYPKLAGTSDAAQDQTAAARLWAESQISTGVAFLLESAGGMEKTLT